MFSVCVCVKKYISSLILSIDLMFPRCTFSVTVGELLSCPIYFECVFVLERACISSLILYPLTKCSTRHIMYFLSG